MQQHELAATMEDAAGLCRFELEGKARWRVVVGAAHDDEAIGLAEAEFRPRRQGRFGAIDDVAGIRFAAREPFGIAIERFRPEHLHEIAEAP